MTQVLSDAVGRDLHAYVDAFESAWRRQGSANPADHLPPPGHPLHFGVLCEIVRVDMELHWNAGRPRGLADYRAAFPSLFTDADAVREIALEECRLRRQAGEEPEIDELLRRVEAPVEQSRSKPVADDTPADGPRTVQMPDATPGSDATRKKMLDAWCASAGAEPGVADVMRQFHKESPAVATRIAEAVCAMPAAGEDFLGFKLLAELGRGAFGRVFLAQQGNLANRLVALKIATDLFAESQTLAQLQHTNIVPIYSIHRAGALQAVCMPFFGSATFGDVVKSIEATGSRPVSGKAIVSTLNQRHSATHQSVSAASKLAHDSRPAGTGSAEAVTAQGAVTLRIAHKNRRTADLEQLERRGYVEAVLWVVARLARGLAHAHERGIVHRDLKPANILLSDDGQPMLLDFNLSEDTKLRGGAASARMGGTLPYMSPEQLEAFQGKPREVGARSDIYSLGVILFELLNGQHPFPRQTGGMDTLLPRMIEDRSHPQLTVDRLKTAVSPAVVSILRHCLEVEPARRYPSGTELAEDLERHLDNLPLRHARETSLVERGSKLVRRHPRGTLSVLVAAAALVLIGTPATWLVVRDREAARTARTAREYVEREVPVIQTLLNEGNDDAADRDEGIRRNHELLVRYGVLDNPAWRTESTVTYLPPHERARLIDDVRDLLTLQARALSRSADAERDPARRQAQLADAWRLTELAERESPDGTLSRAGWTHRAALARQLGYAEDARRFDALAAQTPVATTRDRFALAMEHLRAGRHRAALELLDRVVMEEPQLVWAYFCQGLCYREMGNFTEALACYKVCIARVPDSHVFYHNRGLVYLLQKRFVQAAADFDEALRLRPDLPDLHLSRGVAYAEHGEHEEAVAQFTAALDGGAKQTRIYLLRGRSLDKLGDTEAAARDREKWNRLTPTDEISWTARGVARLSKEPHAALADFEEALKLNPRYFAALQNKAHVLCEILKRNEDALKVMDRQVEVYPDFVPGILGRGVIRARLGQRAEALEDADGALDRDRGPDTYYQVANIYALTSRQQSKDHAKALYYLSKALQYGFGADIVDGDADMDPIRQLPEFQDLVKAAKKLKAGASDQAP